MTREHYHKAWTEKKKPHIYLASSWRNPHYLGVLEKLKDYRVFDFRSDTGFHFADMEPVINAAIEEDQKNWTQWNLRDFAHARTHAAMHTAYKWDLQGLQDSTVLVLVQPAGISAHLELGIAQGMGKKTAIYYPDENDFKEPELMTLGAFLCWDFDILMAWLHQNVGLYGG